MDYRTCKLLNYPYFARDGTYEEKIGHSPVLIPKLES
jgi:hypothetical protein